MSIKFHKMKFIKLTSLLLIFFCCAEIQGTFAQTSLFSYNHYVNENGDTLNYRLLFPDYNTMRKYPLVVFLHGSGECGNDNEAQLKWGVGKFADERLMIQYPAFVLAPQCPSDMEWANYDEDETSRTLTLKPSPSKPMELVISLIQQLMAEFPIDTSRIYITGLSMGGKGTYDAIQRYPNLFAAAVPVCGAGDTSRAASIAHISIWIFHGAEDPVIDPLYSIDMLSALIQAGAYPGFTQYPQVGHFSWLGAYTDPLMMSWLFGQRK